MRFLDDSFTKNFEERRDEIARRYPGSITSQSEHLTLRLELALEALEAGVWEYHPRSGELLWDRRMRELFGLLDGAVQGLSYDDFKKSLHEDDLLLVENALSESLETGRRLNGQFRITKPTGGLRHLRVSGMPYQLPSGETIVVGANWDVTSDVVLHEELRAAEVKARAQNEQLAAAHAEMERLMLHDALTNLPNRRYLERFLVEHLRFGSKTACLQIDLDHFKSVNDTDGHAVGDEVLKIAADRLLNEVPERCFLGRLGGDEFLALIIGSDADVKARAIAEGMLASFRVPMLVAGGSYDIGLSIGIAVSDDGVATSLMAAADEALYRAKDAGRGRYAESTVLSHTK